MTGAGVLAAVLDDDGAPCLRRRPPCAGLLLGLAPAAALLRCAQVVSLTSKPGQPVSSTVQLDGYTAKVRGVNSRVPFTVDAVDHAELIVSRLGRPEFRTAIAGGKPSSTAGSSPSGFPAVVESGPRFDHRSRALPGALCGLEHGGRASRPFHGGAHCCTIVAPTRCPATPGTPRPVDADLVNASATVIDESGHVVLLTADDRFAYQFSSFAHSGMPVEVLELRGHAFVNSTEDYLGLVDEDATLWLTLFEQDPSKTDGRGFLAAWVADEDRLGQSSQAWQYLHQLDESGQLAWKPVFAGEPAGPGAAAFLAQLRALLVKTGYQTS